MDIEKAQKIKEEGQMIEQHNRHASQKDEKLEASRNSNKARLTGRRGDDLERDMEGKPLK